MDQSRKEAIKKAAEALFTPERYPGGDCWYGFTRGAKWADENPLSSWVDVKDAMPDETANCIWCRVPTVEAPWIGTMIDDDFSENYYTHWMPLRNEFFPDYLPQPPTK
jgi:hypothetical protein